MAKGSIAKESLTKLIVDALGDSFVTIQDKKIYAWADDGGEKVQIAISMTMPKTPVESAGSEVYGDNEASSKSPAAVTPVELSPADKEKVAALMEKLGVKPSAT